MRAWHQHDVEAVPSGSTCVSLMLHIHVRLSCTVFHQPEWSAQVHVACVCVGGDEGGTADRASISRLDARRTADVRVLHHPWGRAQHTDLHACGRVEEVVEVMRLRGVQVDQRNAWSYSGSSTSQLIVVAYASAASENEVMSHRVEHHDIASATSCGLASYTGKSPPFMRPIVCPEVTTVIAPPQVFSGSRSRQIVGIPAAAASDCSIDSPPYRRGCSSTSTSSPHRSQ